ncbi:hypothetical protein Tco_0249728, partial [Tanacetum coccineum]
TIKEGSGVGIILVSPDEKMHSYAIRLKFSASDHAIDCEALLAGLVASINKVWWHGMEQELMTSGLLGLKDFLVLLKLLLLVIVSTAGED